MSKSGKTTLSDLKAMLADIGNSPVREKTASNWEDDFLGNNSSSTNLFAQSEREAYEARIQALEKSNKDLTRTLEETLGELGGKDDTIGELLTVASEFEVNLIAKDKQAALREKALEEAEIAVKVSTGEVEALNALLASRNKDVGILEARFLEDLRLSRSENALFQRSLDQANKINEAQGKTILEKDGQILALQTDGRIKDTVIKEKTSEIEEIIPELYTAIATLKPRLKQGEWHKDLAGKALNRLGLAPEKIQALLDRRLDEAGKVVQRTEEEAASDRGFDVEGDKKTQGVLDRANGRKRMLTLNSTSSVQSSKDESHVSKLTRLRAEQLNYSVSTTSNSTTSNLSTTEKLAQVRAQQASKVVSK